MVIEPDNTTERVALVTYHLMQEKQLTTAQIARIAGMSCNGARRMVCKMSRVVPVTNEGDRWSWAGDGALGYGIGENDD